MLYNVLAEYIFLIYIASYIVVLSVNDTSIHPYVNSTWLTLKHQETHGCVVSTVATDALVLKHQVTSILNAD